MKEGGEGDDAHPPETTAQTQNIAEEAHFISLVQLPAHSPTSVRASEHTRCLQECP